jgi:(1->4)-alpha-D-glucan 1-alpha-D-glucosylmutase
MAATVESPWWRDVLEHGRASPFAPFFDIEWDRPLGSGRGKVVLPILDAPLAEILASRGMTLELRPVGPVVVHGETALPLDPATMPRILSQGAGTAWAQELPAPLAEVALVLERLPPRDATPANGRGARRARARAAVDALWALYQENGLAHDVIERALAAHDPAEPEGRTRLGRVLAEQPWWPIPWRDADIHINYRRFFAINDLVGLRVEDSTVFDATHALVRRLVEEGRVQGLRVDHVDGLSDPLGYLERLRALVGESFYIIVEKILGRSEMLRDSWPVQGTTGYDFLGMANGVFVDPHGLAELERDYGRRTGQASDFENVAYRRKREIAMRYFSGAFRGLTDVLVPLARLDPRGRELSENELGPALVEVTARLPVYRTYVRGALLHPHDEASISYAFSEARRCAADLPPETLDVLETILRGENRGLVELHVEGVGSPIPRDRCAEITRRWQQLAGAIMAKGVEDTAFYAYDPLISLNEVGSDPGFGTVSRDELHAWCTGRALEWPGSMNATSTHDTKRSEDVRARIAVLSEIPERWAALLDRWRALNDAKAEVVDGERAPSPAREISLYQTLLGAWPLDPAELPAFGERLAEYLPKAIREAKIHSRWEAPNTPYEDAVVRFALRLLDADSFLSDFLPFEEEVAFHGMLNSLAQTVLKLCAPGVPDIFQGCEQWRFSLVDPDNRRPVDFTVRETSQDEPWDPFSDLVASWKDGRLKQVVTWRLLSLRRAHPDVFARGEYQPLEVEGPLARHVIAFARGLGDRWVVVTVPVRTVGLLARQGNRISALFDSGLWSDTRVVPPPGLDSAKWASVLDEPAGEGRLQLSALPAVYFLG